MGARGARSSELLASETLSLLASASGPAVASNVARKLIKRLIDSRASRLAVLLRFKQSRRLFVSPFSCFSPEASSAT